MLTVSEAISFVTPIEAIEVMSKRGQRVTAENFTPEEVAHTAREVLERFERGIQQIAEASVAKTQDLGMFLPEPGGPAP
jgi:hypothetical protein